MNKLDAYYPFATELLRRSGAVTNKAWLASRFAPPQALRKKTCISCRGEQNERSSGKRKAGFLFSGSKRSKQVYTVASAEGHRYISMRW